MKKHLVISVLCLAGIFAGCTSVEKTLNGLPQVSGDIHFAQQSPLGSVTIDAKNLQQTPEQATADELTVQVSAPLVGTTAATFTNYKRVKRQP